MSGTLDDFIEVTQQDAEVDIERLRALSFYGVPDAHRVVVWQLLLNHLLVAHSNRDMARQRPVDLAKMYRDELEGYRQDVAIFQSAKTRERMLAILLRLHEHDPYLPEDLSFVHLLGPCVFALKRMEVAEKCFMLLVKALDMRPASQEVNLKRFMILFRSRLPLLYAYFEEEDLKPRAWAMSWLQCLFARRLPLPCLVRLWDAYFSSSEGFDIHVFVCIALLSDYQEDLLDMTHVELREFMNKVPHFDVDRLVSNAFNLKSDYEVSE